MLGYPCFIPKNRGFAPKLISKLLLQNFVSSKKPDISEKFTNFGNQTIPKLVKTKSSENSIFGRALRQFQPFQEKNHFLAVLPPLLIMF